MTLRRVSIPTPNYSSRGGTPVRLVVLHTAQGSSNYRDLGAYFANGTDQASSHVGIDDTPGEIGEYVRRPDKSWTQAAANPYSVSAELCGWAEWTAAQWHNEHAVMLENTAAWIAEECAAFGIPLRALTAGEAQGGKAGVCDHAALGANGGGHWDIGSGISVAELVAMAAGGAPAAPTKKKRGHSMIAETSTGDGYWTTTTDGAIGAFGDAQYAEGAFAPDVIPAGHEIVGIAGKGTDGYWLLGSDGSIYAFGSAQFLGRPDRV